ncbi:hypothetical protein PIB30_046691 [Stylosanthes scabra]|uniref:KIB1-4 beta-propeller domain-containing protein n=1 Tax=Stylosanthes scabra TaxID=79078 RepID=A0ABU6UJ84_9FABA|nr:hypothetical protein [Stylosanthes scabra]
MAEVVDQWPNIHLHQDMLKEIAKRLYSYDDYLQLLLVCKQWNFKLPKIPITNKSPWLLLPVSGGASVKEEDIYHIMQLLTIFEATFDTRSLQDKGIYHLTLPDLQYKLIRGSCYGWLIIVSIYEGTITMLNPLTKACLDLPPILNLPDVIHDDDECTYFLGPYKIMEPVILANQILVWKVVINSAPMNNNNNDFLAVAIYGASRLAFYKPKIREWVKLSTSHPDTYFQDVIFFEEKIYALDDEGQLYKFHVKMNAEQPAGRVHEVTPPSDILSQEECPNLKYLVGCADGSLLMVVRHFKNLKENGKKGYHETVKFDVYELKKNAKAWSRISSLGDYVLAIGFNASVQILAADLSNCKGNQIYFTDNETLENHKCYHNIGIFNLEDESCQTVLSDVNFSSPPVWIFP